MIILGSHCSPCARVHAHCHTENERTVEAAAALEKGDLATMGKLMAQSHVSMRDDFEVLLPSCAARAASRTAARL